MAIIDIRTVKKELRADCKDYRKSLRLAEKAKMDEAIFQRLIALPAYRQARLVLIYMSTPIEVATFRLMEYALKQGKTVGAPRCADTGTTMDFYRITGMADLEPGTFSVLEPIPGKCKKLKRFGSSVCIVPGLSFDDEGYRLGYGKGYYDRFLGKYPGKTICICYQNCLRPILPHGRYDRAVDILVTETQTVSRSRTEKRQKSRPASRKPEIHFSAIQKKLPKKGASSGKGTSNR